MVGFLSKSFHAATGVKGLEGKFEVLMQGRYRCFRELSRTTAPLREQPISPRHAPRHALSSRENTLLLMVTPRHHCTRMHSTRTLARVRVAPP
eukprot:scaffold55670_cov69-Phaeocystis_antarctica.AAC.1